MDDSLFIFLSAKPHWAKFAKCNLDGLPVSWFITNSETPTFRQSERIAAYCRDCDVRTECLELGLSQPDTTGFFGGVHLGSNRNRQKAQTTLVELRARTASRVPSTSNASIRSTS